MKKHLLLFLILFPALFAKAQDEFSYGVKTGLNMATYIDDSDGYSMLSCFHVGIYGIFPLTDVLAVQSEFIYSMQGTQIKNGDVTLSLFANYINIPVLAKYFVTEGLSLEAGPQIGINVGGETKNDNNGVGVNLGTEDSVFNALDLGMAFGVGYKLETGLNFAARYNLGLTNVYKHSEDFPRKNSVIQLSVGYSF